MDYSSRISQLLLDCESSGVAIKYGTSKTKFESKGKEIFILSDLHLTVGPGNDTKGSSEKYFTDSSFANFIGYIKKQVLPHSGILIINGDFIDFLRIISIPEKEDFYEWKNILEKIGIGKEINFLKSSISRREIRYGLNTNEYKSVWKLNLVIKSHQEVFAALAEWLQRDNKLIILKGNHDLELYWPAIRNLIRLHIAEKLCSEKKEHDLEIILKTKVLPNLIFVDDCLVIDDQYYIEHGHKYDRYCHCIGGPLLKNKEELNTPFGSYFNRYLLNHIEIAAGPLFP